MDDFTVVPQSLIAYLKKLAEKGFTDTFSLYQMGMEDGEVALAQAVLETLHIPFTKASI